MTAPRIEMDLKKIRHNTRCLVERLDIRGINVTGVTKGVCGYPAVAQAMLDGGATGLAESRIKNIERLRKAGITDSITMIRTPMLSQAEQIVRLCDTSCNTELEVIARLAMEARKRKTVHNIILMVEMGDLREGIRPKYLTAIAEQVTKMPGVALKGIGANFACLGGMVPNAARMASLSALADETESACSPFLERVSGGNSANLPWALNTETTGRINDLRLGEAILLGVDPVSGDQIGGLHTDAFTLVAEVIETKVKPDPGYLSFVNPEYAALRPVPDNNLTMRSILAVGLQDTDTSGLCFPKGITFLGATSDHLVVQTNLSALRPGAELRFQLNYSALMRAMAAPDIAKVLLEDQPLPKSLSTRPRLMLV
jgi:predicted amino acid racemase